MSYYRECPECGASLDPGEKCDCKKKEACTDGAAQTSSIKYAIKYQPNYTTQKGVLSSATSGNYTS